MRILSKAEIDELLQDMDWDQASALRELYHQHRTQAVPHSKVWLKNLEHLPMLISFGYVKGNKEDGYLLTRQGREYLRDKHPKECP